MKKLYTAPLANCINIECATMIATSSLPVGGNEKIEVEGDILSNRRQADWDDMDD